MMRAIGMTDKDFETPIVGSFQPGRKHTVIFTYMTLEIGKEGVKSAGAWPVQFGTITVADGIAMERLVCASP